VKKHWPLFAGIGFIVIVLILCLVSTPIHLIAPSQVDKIVLHTYDHQSSGKHILTDSETVALTFLYNISIPNGQITGEPCCDSYGFSVHYKDGKTLYVGEGARSKMIVRPEGSGFDEQYYILNQALIDYIWKLAEKYDLPIN